jgi:hypothetical protein
MTEPDRQPDAAAGEPRPCERWGAARRDCAPHRGNVLLLAWVAWGLRLSSFCLVVTGWAVLPLAGAVHWLAPRDLERMTAGTMDPNGKGQAQQAQKLAWQALAFGVVGGLRCGVPWVLMLGSLLQSGAALL